MVKDVQDMSKLVIDVSTINGETFIGKNIPSLPFGSFDSAVYFWVEDVLMMYPMSQIKYIKLYVK